MGMTVPEATLAACRAIDSQAITAPSREYVHSGGRCVALLDPMTEPNSHYWDFNSNAAPWRQPCYGGEGKSLTVFFDRSNGRLSEIRLSCNVTLP
jgi:hypothetical protein